MRFLRRWRLLLLVFVIATLSAALWVGWQAWQVNRDLSAAAADAKTLQQAVEDGDDPATDAALADLQEHSTSAAERTSGWTWSALSHAPVYGDDARGVRLVSDVVAELSNNGIEPLVRTSTDLESLLPKEGRIDVDTVRSLQSPVSDGKTALEAAVEQLSGEDPVGFVGPLREKYRELQSQIADAADVMSTADTALQVMPGMLGDGERRKYLLIFQNNAEIRSTGGLPGAVSLVEAEDGKVELTRQVAANTFGETDKPVLPLTPEERQIYGPQLGTYFLDANFTPDFPRTADLMKARWEQEYDDSLDGVFSLDPVTLSYILKAVGPVPVGDVTLTSDNAVDELLHQVYLRYEDPADQDAFFRDVARAVFDKVSSGAESPQELIRALVRGADEGRVYVHSFDSQEQSDLAGTQVAGELITDPDAAPQVGVYLNDATGAKMSYYLRYDVKVDATYCKDGVQGLSAKAHLLSDAPEDAASLPDYVTGAGVFGTEPGSQLVLVRLFSPVDGEISHIQLNGAPIDAEPVIQDGREVMTTVVQLEPQFTVDLTWRMTTGPDQTGDVETSVTPGVVARKLSSVVATACS